MSKSEVTYIYWNGILLCSKDQVWLRNHFLIETKQNEWRTSRNVYSQQMLHSILSFVETPSLERNCLKVALTLSFDCLSWASCVISFFASCPLVELDERRPNILYFLKIPKHFTRKKTIICNLPLFTREDPVNIWFCVDWLLACGLSHWCCLCCPCWILANVAVLSHVSCKSIIAMHNFRTNFKMKNPWINWPD